MVPVADTEQSEEVLRFVSNHNAVILSSSLFSKELKYISFAKVTT